MTHTFTGGQHRATTVLIVLQPCGSFLHRHRSQGSAHGESARTFRHARPLTKRRGNGNLGHHTQLYDLGTQRRRPVVKLLRRDWPQAPWGLESVGHTSINTMHLCQQTGVRTSQHS